jgi:hypothetical protein
MTLTTETLTPREPAVDLVKLISEGTYTSFPQALKEFISNAYDADAAQVDITIDEDSNSIVIRDNGVGMTLSDFLNYFASIARPGPSGARSARGRTRLGRLKIGRFGIGSLAVVGTAKELSVRSVRRLSGEGFEASINLAELREHFYKGEDLSRCWRFECKHWGGESDRTHFTEIRLHGLRDDLRALLNHPGEKSTGEFFESTKQLSGIDELAWQLGVICPAAYSQAYPIPKSSLNRRTDSVVIDHARRLLRDNFGIFLNGNPVRRPIFAPRYHPDKLKDLSKGRLLERRGLGFEVRCFRSPKGAPVYYEGYLVVQAAQLFPVELRGLLIRLRGVGIGWHRAANLGSATLSTMLPNLTGELWVQGLEDALQFDRESFREDHPTYRWLVKQLEELASKEAVEFRKRSRKRTSEAKKGSGEPKTTAAAGAAATTDAEETADTQAHTTAGTTAGATSSQREPEGFVSPEIFTRQPEYITRLIPQINGCLERGYFEACAMMIRRLAETLICELYASRGWEGELKDPTTHEFVGLRAMVNKICGDQRIGLNKRIQDGLKTTKDLGDIAAHDFKVRIRKSDLEGVRSSFRFTCERLIYEIGLKRA